MSAPQSAEESIQVIRQLMERATTYRVLSTTSAFSGALASFAVGGYLFMNGSSVGIGMFVGLWLAVLLVLDCVNSFFTFQKFETAEVIVPVTSDDSRSHHDVAGIFGGWSDRVSSLHS